MVNACSDWYWFTVNGGRLVLGMKQGIKGWFFQVGSVAVADLNIG
jgi:hypothetical protein